MRISALIKQKIAEEQENVNIKCLNQAKRNSDLYVHVE